MFFYIDWLYIILVLPAVILSIFASAKVKTTFNKYSKEFSSSTRWNFHPRLRLMMFMSAPFRFRSYFAVLLHNSQYPFVFPLQYPDSRDEVATEGACAAT